jgi:hypothetical protein
MYTLAHDAEDSGAPIGARPDVGLPAGPQRLTSATSTSSCWAATCWWRRSTAARPPAAAGARASTCRRAAGTTTGTAARCRPAPKAATSTCRSRWTSCRCSCAPAPSCRCTRRCCTTARSRRTGSPSTCTRRAVASTRTVRRRRQHAPLPRRRIQPAAHHACSAEGADLHLSIAPCDGSYPGQEAQRGYAPAHAGRAEAGRGAGRWPRAAGCRAPRAAGSAEGLVLRRRRTPRHPAREDRAEDIRQPLALTLDAQACWPRADDVPSRRAGLGRAMPADSDAGGQPPGRGTGPELEKAFDGNPTPGSARCAARRCAAARTNGCSASANGA